MIERRKSSRCREVQEKEGVRGISLVDHLITNQYLLNTFSLQDGYSGDLLLEGENMSALEREGDLTPVVKLWRKTVRIWRKAPEGLGLPVSVSYI